MAEPLISIITPSYNQERFLGACIDSARAQSYTNWEMLVVDDGSTDSTLEIARSYAALDKRVRVLAEPHRGIWRLDETYNAGLREARGSLIAILEGDDLWLAHRLEVQVPLFDDGVVLVFGRWKAMMEDGQEVTIRGFRPRDLTDLMNRPPGTALRVLLARNPIVPCTVLLDRRAVDRVGGFRNVAGFPAVDYPTWLRLALEGEFRIVDAPVAFWRVHRDQSTHSLVVDLARGCGTFTLDYFRALSPEVRLLSGWNEQRLLRVLGNRVALAHAQAGRRRLRERNRRAALPELLTALRDGDVTTKAKAGVGLACAISGVDIEWVAAVMGRPNWWSPHRQRCR